MLALLFAVGAAILAHGVPSPQCVETPSSPSLPALQVCVEGQSAVLTVVRSQEGGWPFSSTSVLSSLEGCAIDPSGPLLEQDGAASSKTDLGATVSVVQHVICKPGEYSSVERKARIVDTFGVVVNTNTNATVVVLGWNVSVVSNENATWTAPIVSTLAMKNHCTTAVKCIGLPVDLGMEMATVAGGCRPK